MENSDLKNPNEQLPTNHSPIAGFWLRLLAAGIDSFLLGLIGWLLGLFFYQQFMHIGSSGRLVGFIIALLYFVPFNSRLGGGQTLGKKLLGIRVISTTGDRLGLAKSFVRSCILSIPFFLNGVPIPLPILKSAAGIVFGVAVFGLGLSLIYLFVFNRRTRQSLHDLAVGSYVVRVGSEAEEKLQIWKGHYVLVGVILLLSAVLPFVVGRFAQMALFAEIMPAYEAIVREPEVTTAQLTAGQNYSWDTKGKRSVSSANAIVRLNRSIADKNAEAEKLARIILQNSPAVSNKDSLSITVVEGYDIGIASAFVSQGFNYRPEEWRQRIDSSHASNLAPAPSPSPK